MFRLLRGLSFGKLLLYAILWFFIVGPFFRAIYNSIVMFYAWMIP